MTKFYKASTLAVLAIALVICTTLTKSAIVPEHLYTPIPRNAAVKINSDLPVTALVLAGKVMVINKHPCKIDVFLRVDGKEDVYIVGPGSHEEPKDSLLSEGIEPGARVHAWAREQSLSDSSDEE